LGEADQIIAYAWTAKVPAPGALLRSEPLPADLVLDNAATSLRILYSSTDGIGGKTPIAVSGALFVPKGAPPAGGWPLVAWAHGAVGAAAACAPSFRDRSERDVKYLNSWLTAGFAIVAADYQGLGPAGGHPYLATRPEAYGVLDAVRAARSQPDPAPAAAAVRGRRDARSRRSAGNADRPGARRLSGRKPGGVAALRRARS